MQAKMKSGADERPKSHLQPKLGATANAKATSKQAPSAQKHCRVLKIAEFISISIEYQMYVLFIWIIYLHPIKQHIWHAV